MAVRPRPPVSSKTHLAVVVADGRVVRSVAARCVSRRSGGDLLPNVPSRNHAGASNSGSVDHRYCGTARPFTVEQLTHFLRCRTTRLRLSGVSSVLGSASVPRSRCRLLHSSGDWVAGAHRSIAPSSREPRHPGARVIDADPHDVCDSLGIQSVPQRQLKHLAVTATQRGRARSTSERASAASSSVPGSSLMTVTVS